MVMYREEWAWSCTERRSGRGHVQRGGVGVVMYSEEWAWSCTERSGRDHVQKGVGVAMYREVWVWSLVLRRTK